MNLIKKIRNDHLISSDMKKVWAVEMELLKKLLDVCEKYNLRIWAEGGTLLGTVREHGFIPWDDDIDMAMPREDYDRLQEIAKDEFQPPYFFQTGYTDIFPYGMAKIRKDGTSAISVGSVPYNFHQGIFIDIFPLDTIPDKDKELKSFTDSLEADRAEMKLYCNHAFSWTNPRYNWYIYKLKRKFNSLGFANYVKSFENKCRQYMSSSFSRIALVSWKWDERYVRQKEWYNETLFMSFEDMMMPVPSGYDRILATQFGDYMTPVQAPSMHGSFEALNVSRPYQETLPIIRKRHRFDNLRSRKESFLKFCVFFLKIKDNN